MGGGVFGVVAVVLIGRCLSVFAGDDIQSQVAGVFGDVFHTGRVQRHDGACAVEVGDVGL